MISIPPGAVAVDVTDQLNERTNSLYEQIIEVFNLRLHAIDDRYGIYDEAQFNAALPSVKLAYVSDKEAETFAAASVAGALCHSMTRLMDDEAKGCCMTCIVEMSRTMQPPPLRRGLMHVRHMTEPLPPCDDPTCRTCQEAKKNKEMPA